MIYITNKNGITPQFSKVLDRFKANSRTYQVEQEVFYQKDNLQKTYHIELKCLENINPSVDIKLIPKQLIPTEITNIYSYENFIVFSSTLGKTADELIQSSLQKEDYYKSYLMDSWFSECVETINKQIDKLTNDHLESNKRSNRFSPGYGKINILINKKLDRQLEFSNITVNSRTGILLPEKSTICLIGINIQITNERWRSFYEDLKHLFKN
ncbi:hypothetical protein [Natranaerobius trueperi]|uniref:Uncharacterized protein n=1 Tax=Natranaerobius trueperi TaxID=759412 RepID=A0A226BVD9_9FIRM|nr:hypothetical protein [Natranaerobius trueperi]OWZ83008.1 hypothetical protein CDO51_10940 [Natranaerobius trueperi]